MGLVRCQNRPAFYDGMIARGHEGEEVAKFPPADYLEHVPSTSSPWSLPQFPYLKKFGWKGIVDGQESGMYRVAPLARINVADRMSTPLRRSNTSA